MMNLDDLNLLTQDDDLILNGGEDIDLIYAFMFGDTSPGPGESSTPQLVPPPCQTNNVELDVLAVLLALEEW